MDVSATFFAFFGLIKSQAMNYSDERTWSLSTFGYDGRNGDGSATLCVRMIIASQLACGIPRGRPRQTWRITVNKETESLKKSCNEL